MQDKHPHRPTPKQPRESITQRAAEHPAQTKRGEQPPERPYEERPVDPAHHAVGEQIGRVALTASTMRVDKQPTDVRMEEPAQGAAPTMAVIEVRTMRVADLVGERVMLAMVGHPRDDRPFDRSRAKDRH